LQVVGRAEPGEPVSAIPPASGPAFLAEAGVARPARALAGECRDQAADFQAVLRAVAPSDGPA